MPRSHGVCQRDGLLFQRLIFIPREVLGHELARTGLAIHVRVECQYLAGVEVRTDEGIQLPSLELVCTPDLSFPQGEAFPCLCNGAAPNSIEYQPAPEFILYGQLVVFPRLLTSVIAASNA